MIKSRTNLILGTLGIMTIVLAGSFAYELSAYNSEVSTVNRLMATQQTLEAQLASARSNATALAAGETQLQLELHNLTALEAALRAQVAFLTPFGSVYHSMFRGIFRPVIENSSNQFFARGNELTKVGSFYASDIDFVLVNVTKLSPLSGAAITFGCYCNALPSADYVTTKNFLLNGTSGVVIMPGGTGSSTSTSKSGLAIPQRERFRLPSTPLLEQSPTSHSENRQSNPKTTTETKHRGSP